MARIGQGSIRALLVEILMSPIDESVAAEPHTGDPAAPVRPMTETDQGAPDHLTASKILNADNGNGVEGTVCVYTGLVH